MRRLQQLTVLVFVLMLLIFGAVTVKCVLLADRTPPVLQCDSDTIYVSVNEQSAALLYGLTATDNHDGDLTDRILVQGVTPLITKDSAIATYVVFDDANNSATCSRTVQYVDYRTPRFALAKPLVYTVGQPLALNDRLSAYDVMDGNLSDRIRISSHNIIPTVPGVYQLNLQVYNSVGDISTLPLSVVLTDEPVAQHILLDAYLHYISVGDDFDPASYITKVLQDDMTAGDPADVTIKSDVNPQIPGNYTVEYQYETNGNTYTTLLTVVVE